MSNQDLEDYLNERKQSEIEKKKKAEKVLENLRKSEEEYKEKFLLAFKTIIRPKISELAKMFKKEGHLLQHKRDNFQGVPFEVEYELTLNEENRSGYEIAFYGHRDCDIKFSMKPTTVIGVYIPYLKNFSFEEFNAVAINVEIIEGLKSFEN